GGVVAMIVPQRRFDAPAQEGLRSEEHTSELQSLTNLVCRLLLEKKTKSSGFPASANSIRLVLAKALISTGTFEPFVFFFNDTATTEIYPLSLHDALPI